VEDFNDLDRFQEDKYVITNEATLLDKGYVSDDTVSHYYYYPPAPFGGMGIAQPPIPVSGDQGVVHQMEQHIPDGTVALKEGAKVISSDSKHLGNVEKVFVDTGSARATHLLITKGLLLKERKLIPTDWVDTVDEDEVFLAVDSSFAARLPDYQENKE
jgi:hypothetical protein